MDPQSDVDTVDAIIPRKSRAWPDSALVQVDLDGLSHRGKVRPNNEDHFFIGRFGRFLDTLQTSLPAGAVPVQSLETGYAMVVADGVGGRAAGEEASRLAISSLINLVLHTPDWILRLDDESLSREVMRRATERYDQINQALGEEARQVAGLSGFATTLTLAFSLGRELFVSHIGDSRAYLLNHGKLHQLTRDHTVAQELADQQVIDRKHVATHYWRHVLTQTLGDHGRRIQPDVMWITLEDNDCLLLCTDGLTDMVSEQVISDMLSRAETAQLMCQRLVDRALEAGGKDNVTVLTARYRLPASTPLA